MDATLAASRVGKMTASMAYTIMGEKLSNKGIQDLVASLAFQRVYGDPQEEGYHSRAMARGNEFEPRAMDWYIFQTDRVPDTTPVCLDHPRVPWVAATPDGLLLPLRIVEAKCLLHKAWMEARERRRVPSSYRWQVQWQLWVTGAQVCDFVVWHPVGGGFVVEVYPDHSDFEQMEQRAQVINNLVRNWVEATK